MGLLLLLGDLVLSIELGLNLASSFPPVTLLLAVGACSLNSLGTVSTFGSMGNLGNKPNG